MNPVPRRISDLLTDLIDTGARVLGKPHIAFGEADRLAALQLEIEQAVRRPADGRRLIDDASSMLARSLAEFAGGAGRAEHAGKWRAIAEVLTPLIERDRARALEEELRLMTTRGAEEWQR